MKTKRQVLTELRKANKALREVELLYNLEEATDKELWAAIEVVEAIEIILINEY